MAARKVTPKKTQLSPPKKAASSRKSIKSPSSTSLMDYFRLSESYTSLVLGMIVVIVLSVILVSLFKTRPSSSSIDSQQSATSISTIADQIEGASPTVTAGVTEAPTPTLTPTAQPTNTVQPQNSITKTVGAVTYRIKAGDDLWKIAEEQYHDGYKWIDIAKANNLTNPGVINVDNVLVLPKITSSPTPTVEKPAETAVSSQGKIAGSSYVIKTGDDLWDIAERAYGTGYKWTDIAKANNLSSPNVIHVGNSLKIPR